MPFSNSSKKERNLQNTEISFFKNLWFEIKYGLKNIYSEIRGFKRGIKNIIKWIPIIYKDADWDYEFLIDILIFKLKSMEEFYFSDKPWRVNAEQRGKQIREARTKLEEAFLDVRTPFTTDKHAQASDRAFNVIKKNIFDWWD